MNAGQLAASVALATGLDKNQARDALNATLHAIQSEVRKGGKVSIPGFGSFAPLTRQARKGRNPKTGDSVNIPTRTVPKFSAGRVFREVVSKERQIEKLVLTARPRIVKAKTRQAPKKTKAVKRKAASRKAARRKIGKKAIRRSAKKK